MPKKDINLFVTEIISPSGEKRRPLKSAYSGTIGSKLEVQLSSKQVEQIAKTIVEQIREEIKVDTAKAMGLGGRGQPVPIPQTAKFAESFNYKITGAKTIEITSDWPTAEAHTIGKRGELELDAKNKSNTPPFPMTWLTSPKVPYAQIVQDNGRVVVRTTPDPTKGKAFWIHPGFRRYSFLERGIQKGKQKALENLASDLFAQMISEKGLIPK